MALTEKERLRLVALDKKHLEKGLTAAELKESQKLVAKKAQP